MPCPECGKFQILRWPSVEWPETDPAGAAYRCEHCALVIPAFKKPWMLARGEWRPANPGSKVAGSRDYRDRKKRKGRGLTAEPPKNEPLRKPPAPEHGEDQQDANAA